MHKPEFLCVVLLCVAAAAAGKKFESIQKGNVTLEETADEKKQFKRVSSYYGPLVQWFKKVLGPKVSKVEVSKRLVEAPCAVVASQWGYSAQMEKVMKTQTFADPMHLRMMKGQKVFEINPHHRLMQQLLQRVKEEGEDKMKTEDIQLAEQLFDAAMLASGFDVEQPAQLAAVLYRGLASQVGVDPTDPINEHIELPEEEEKTDTAAAAEDEEEHADNRSAEDLFAGLDLGNDLKDEL